jgi:hypothetical protein
LSSAPGVFGGTFGALAYARERSAPALGEQAGRWPVRSGSAAAFAADELVGLVGARGVLALAAVDPLAFAVGRVDGVVAGASGDLVGALAAGQRVVAGAA